MRRQSSGRSSGLVSTNDGEQGFWPSYADMMSAVALILFFLMLISYIQNLITGNDLQNTQEVLQTTRDELLIAQDDLLSAQDELAEMQIRLDDTVMQVEEAEAELNLVQLDLDTAKTALSDQEKEIAGQKDTISQQQMLIDRQEDYLAAANEELVEMRGQMQAIAVLRLSILEQIQESIVKIMGDSAKVSIGDNGNIILGERVFFDTGSSAIKSESKPVLNQLIKVFSEFLSDDENAKYIDSIVISGHTDSTGTAASNRTLSTDRANSVLSYLLTGNNGALDKYSKYFCAAGYGATRPVADNSTEEGRSQNRRIEISIILKDESVMEIVEEYLALELPDTGTTTTATTDSDDTSSAASTASSSTTSSGSKTSGSGGKT